MGCCSILSQVSVADPSDIAIFECDECTKESCQILKRDAGFVAVALKLVCCIFMTFNSVGCWCYGSFVPFGKIALNEYDAFSFGFWKHDEDVNYCSQCDRHERQKSSELEIGLSK